MDTRPDLIDILREYIKVPGIKWDSDYAEYKYYEVVSVSPLRSGREGWVWIRTQMPDERVEGWLNPADPDFFEKVDAALIVAMKVIDDTEDTRRALYAARKHLGY